MSNPTIGEFKLPDNPQPPKNNNIKWIAGAIVVGLGFFGYVVQGENNSQPTPVEQSAPKPDTSYSDTPEPEVSYDDITEEVFIDAVQSEVPYMKNAADYEILDLGYQVCEIFASGVTADEYAYLVVEEFPYDEDAQMLAAVIAGAAVATLCPEHGWMLD